MKYEKTSQYGGVCMLEEDFDKLRAERSTADIKEPACE